MEIEKYFYENFKQEDLSYVFYADIIDHFVDNTDFDMIQVSKWLKTNLTIIDGKVVDISCICDPEINNPLNAFDCDSS
jgi:hypothetical protein